MSDIVLDASVPLAIIRGERVHDGVLDLLDGAVISAVNLAEVLTKLHEYGIPASTPFVTELLDLFDRVEPFTESQAALTAALRPHTRHKGLSLGDRACLALGILLDAEIFTAEQLWADLDIGARIHLIR